MREARTAACELGWRAPAAIRERTARFAWRSIAVVAWRANPGEQRGNCARRTNHRDAVGGEERERVSSGSINLGLQLAAVNQAVA